MIFFLLQPQAVVADSVVYSNNPWLKEEGTFYVCGPCEWGCAPVIARKGDRSGRHCQDSPGEPFAAALKLKALVKADLKFFED